LKLGNELGCDSSKWKVTGDDAFALLASKNPTLGKGNTVGINLRVAAYSGIEKAKLTSLSDSLEAARAQCGAHWMPLPVDLCPEQGDEPQTISLLTEGTISSDYKTPDVPDDLIALVSNCHIVITGSYHAAVFALAQGIPVIALAANAYYDSKFKGLASFFSDGIRIVNHTAPEFKTTLLDAVQTQWKMPENKRNVLIEEALRVAESVKSNYRSFFGKS
jgi:colanic acid/amylovoran biosynthesis protein